MKDKELKLENVEAPDILGGASETLRYMNLAENIALTAILSHHPGG